MKMTNKRAKGHVKWFNPDKGYGFIQSAEGEEYFVHFSAIKQQGYRSLADFAEVEFDIEIEPNSGRKLAKNVTGPQQSSVPSSTRPLSARARACAYRTAQEQWFKAMLGRSHGHGAVVPFQPPRAVMPPGAMMPPASLMMPHFVPGISPEELRAQMAAAATVNPRVSADLDMIKEMEAAAAMMLGAPLPEATEADTAQCDEATRIFAALQRHQHAAAVDDADSGPDGQAAQADAAYWAMMNGLQLPGLAPGKENLPVPPQNGDRDRAHYWAMRLEAAQDTLNRIRSGSMTAPPPGFDMPFQDPAMMCPAFDQPPAFPPPPPKSSWPAASSGDGLGVNALPSSSKDAREFRPGEAFMTNEEAIENRCKLPPPGLGPEVPKSTKTATKIAVAKHIEAKAAETANGNLPPPPAYPPPVPFHSVQNRPMMPLGASSPRDALPWLLNMRGDGVTMPYCGSLEETGVPFNRE